MVLYAFPNFCLPIPPLPVLCHSLHRCFSQAIARLFFKWLLAADVPQSPGVCVVPSTELKLSCALFVPQPLCGAGSMARHSTDSSAPARLLGDNSPQQQPPCSPPGWSQTHSLGAQSSLLCCLELACIIAAERAPKKKKLISPIIQAARFYFPVEAERKARCNS